MKIKSTLLSILVVGCLGFTQISSAASSNDNTFKFYVNNKLDRPIRIWVDMGGTDLLKGKRLTPNIREYVGKFQKSSWGNEDYFEIKINYGPEQFNTVLTCNIKTGKPFGTPTTKAYLHIEPANGNKFKAVLTRQPNNSSCSETFT